MEVITNDRNIELIVSFDTIENDAMINGLIQQALILGLDSENVTDGEQLYKRIYLNFIEEDLLAYCISQDYEVNWLKPYNYPYIELGEGTDIKDLYIYQKAIKDGKMLIRIDKAGDSQNPLEPTFEELKEWNKLGNIICNPAVVVEKKKNYSSDKDDII